MPQLGTIKRAGDIGLKDGNYAKYIWLKCPDCGKERWVDLRKARRRKAWGLCRDCSNSRRSKQGNYRWQGGRYKDQMGYMHIKLYKDDEFYKMASSRGDILEHRLVVAKALNRCLLPWEIVHHKGGFARHDNRYPETLELLPTQSEHQVSIQFTRLYNKLLKRIRYLEDEVQRLKSLLGEE